MHGLDLDLWWIYFSWQRNNALVKFPCNIHVEGGQLVEAREGNRVLPSACSGVFNNVNSSVHIFLKYRGAIPGASPVGATCWKGESAFSGLSSFQNLSLLIDSYHSLSVDGKRGIVRKRGFFWVIYYPITASFQKILSSERPNTCPHADSFAKGEQLSNEWDW